MINHRCRRQATSHYLKSARLAAVTVAFLLLLSFGAPSDSFAAQAAAPAKLATLPAAVKSAIDARPHAGDIQKYIKGQVTVLSSDKDPEAQKRARDALVKETAATGSPPSPSFLETYAKALNEQLQPLAKSPSARTRLNAAIAVARVAKNANNGELEPAAAAFAADSCEGVALWGVKASQFILPPVAQAGKPTKLTGAVVAAVKKHAASGDIAEEAYKGVTLQIKNVNAKAVAVTLPDVMQLFAFRVGLYEKQTPPRPDLESRGVNYLTLGTVWDKQGAKERQAIMQLLLNLIGVSAQHVNARGANEPARKAFVEQVQALGDALIAIGQRKDVSDPGLAAAGKALKEITGSTNDVALTERVEAAEAALKGKFPNLKAPPQIAEDAAIEPEPPPPAEEDKPTAAPGAGEEKPAAAKPGGAAPKPAGPAPKPAGAAPKPAGAPPKPPAGPRPGATGEEKPEAP